MQSVQTESNATAAYVGAARTSFLNAQDSVGPAVDAFYAIAGHSIQISIVGQALQAKLTRALAHLRRNATEPPELKIVVWDGTQSGVGMPAPPWDVGPLMTREQMWGVKGDDVQLVCEFAEGPRLSILDREAQSAMHWIADGERLADYEVAAPFFRIMHWWLRDRGLQLTHAAAVGSVSGGILVGGKGGSGKSTTLLACLAAGLGWAGDDYVLLESAEASAAHTIYSAAKLEHDHLRRTLPQLPPALSRRGRGAGDKTLLFLNELYPHQSVSRFPVRAVVLPRVTGGVSRLVSVSPKAGIAAIAPSTLFQLRWAGQEDFKQIAAVVGSVPNYSLELGSDPAAVPDLISGLLLNS